MTKATNGIKSFIATVGGIQLVSAAFNKVSSSIGNAVSRYDTLNRFPKVMQQMGFSAETANASTQKLTDGIQGLPTALDDVVATSQKLTILTGNLEKSTDTTLALNNAFLASGSSTADASRGLIQYTQMLSRGTVDITSWRTLQETMGYALRETAESFKFTGAAATNDLYTALQNGTITFDQFNTKLIELSTKTGGFAEVAKIASEGLATSWGNMGIAITRGLTTMIRNIELALSMSGLQGLSQGIESVGKSFETVLGGLGNQIPGIVAIIIAPFTDISSKLQTAFNTIKTAWNDIMNAMASSNILQNIIDFIAILSLKAMEGAASLSEMFSPVIITAINIFSNAIKFVTDNIDTIIRLLSIAITAIGVFKSAMIIQNVINAWNAATVAIAAYTSASGASALTLVAVNGGLTASQILVGLLTGKITLATAAQWLWNTAILANPIAAAVIAVAALAAGIVIFTSKTDENTKRIEENSKKVKQITDDYNNNTKAIQNNLNTEIAKADGVIILRDKLIALNREIKSGSLTESENTQKKRELKIISDELTRIIPGLVFQFNSETGALQMQEKQIYATTDAYVDMVKKKALATSYSNMIQQSTDALAKLQKQQEELGEAPKKTTTILGMEFITPVDLYKTIKYNETINKITDGVNEANKDLEYALTKSADLMTKDLESLIPTTTTPTGTSTAGGATAAKSTTEKKKQYEIDIENLKRALDRQYITELQYYQGVEQIRNNSMVKGSDDYENYTTDIIQFYNKMAEDIKKTQAEKEQARFENSKKWIDEGVFYERLSTQEIIDAWQRVVDYTVEGTENRLEAERNLYTARQKIEEETFNNSKTWIDKMKFWGIYSTQDVIDAWQRVTDRYKEGTDKRIEAERNLFEVRKQLLSETQAIYDKMQSAEENYTKSVENRAKEIFNAFGLFAELTTGKYAASATTSSEFNEQLRTETAALKSTYDERESESLATLKKEYETRKALITKNFTDENKITKQLELDVLEAQYEKNRKAISEAMKTEYTSAEKSLTETLTAEAKASQKPLKDVLTKNLKDQVAELQIWSDNVRKLAARGIDKGFLAELEAMGPSANEELTALNSMTNSELSEYANLWQEKQNIARRQATAEMQGLRNETDEIITGLYNDLDNIVNSRSNVVGENMIQGIMNSITEKTSGLINQMKSLATTAMDAFNQGLQNNGIGNINAGGITQAQINALNSGYGPLTAAGANALVNQNTFTFSNTFTIADYLDINKISRDLASQTQNEMRSRGITT